LFFGLSESERDSPRAHKLYEAASPINHATADDPAVFLFYAEPDKPLPANAKPGQGIHHPRFGMALKARLDRLGVPCIVRHAMDLPAPDHPNAAMFHEMTAFFTRQIGLEPDELVGGLGPEQAPTRFVATPSSQKTLAGQAIAGGIRAKTIDCPLEGCIFPSRRYVEFSVFRASHAS
jgi:hypothetical protein